MTGTQAMKYTLTYLTSYVGTVRFQLLDIFTSKVKSVSLTQIRLEVEEYTVRFMSRSCTCQNKVHAKVRDTQAQLHSKVRNTPKIRYPLKSGTCQGLVHTKVRYMPKLGTCQVLDQAKVRYTPRSGTRQGQVHAVKPLKLSAGGSI